MSDPTHTKHFKIIHTICSICANTTCITTKLYDSKYLFRSLRRVINSKNYNHGSHDPTLRAYKSKHKWKLNMSEYRNLEMKKAEKPDYLPDPAEGTRSWLR